MSASVLRMRRSSLKAGIMMESSGGATSTYDRTPTLFSGTIVSPPGTALYLWAEDSSTHPAEKVPALRISPCQVFMVNSFPRAQLGGFCVAISRREPQGNLELA